MTEAEWLNCTEPAEMFRCIGWQRGLIRRKSPTHAYLLLHDGPAAAGAAAEALPSEPPMQAALIRDLFGNPFRLVTMSPAILAWQDSTVVRLAQAAYDERHLTAGWRSSRMLWRRLDTGRLTVLADALEEAGCMDADILGHLRGPGPHVRGCWVVDLVLGNWLRQRLIVENGLDQHRAQQIVETLLDQHVAQQSTSSWVVDALLGKS